MEVIETATSMIWSFLVASNICDAKSYQVPNQLIGLGLITGLFVNISERGPTGIFLFITRVMILIASLYILFLLNGIGSGDIKILSVMSSIMGIRNTWQCFIISVVAGGVIVAILCIREKKIIKQKLHYSFYITISFFLMQIMEEISL